MIMSIGELQKNISIIKNTVEPIIIIDKRTNKQISKIEPIIDNDMNLLEEMLSFTKKVDTLYTKEDFEEVYSDNLKEKYSIN